MRLRRVLGVTALVLSLVCRLAIKVSALDEAELSQQIESILNLPDSTSFVTLQEGAAYLDALCEDEDEVIGKVCDKYGERIAAYGERVRRIQETRAENARKKGTSVTTRAQASQPSADPAKKLEPRKSAEPKEAEHSWYLLSSIGPRFERKCDPAAGDEVMKQSRECGSNPRCQLTQRRDSAGKFTYVRVFLPMIVSDVRIDAIWEYYRDKNVCLEELKRTSVRPGDYR